MKRGGVKEEILEMKSFIDFNSFHWQVCLFIKKSTNFDRNGNLENKILFFSFHLTFIFNVFFFGGGVAF